MFASSIYLGVPMRITSSAKKALKVGDCFNSQRRPSMKISKSSGEMVLPCTTPLVGWMVTSSILVVLWVKRYLRRCNCVGFRMPLLEMSLNSYFLSTLSQALEKSMNRIAVQRCFYLRKSICLRTYSLHSSIDTPGMKPNCCLYLVFLRQLRREGRIKPSMNLARGLRATIGRYYSIFGVRGNFLLRQMSLPHRCYLACGLFQQLGCRSVFKVMILFWQVLHNKPVVLHSLSLPIWKSWSEIPS